MHFFHFSTYILAWHWADLAGQQSVIALEEGMRTLYLV
jgi:hypothetical protein